MDRQPRALIDGSGHHSPCLSFSTHAVLGTEKGDKLDVVSILEYVDDAAEVSVNTRMIRNQSKSRTGKFRQSILEDDI
jgi:hypothetical protein